MQLLVLAGRSWLVRDALSGDLVACTCIRLDGLGPRTGAIGCWLAPAWRGRGLAAEVLRLVVLNAPTVGVDHLTLSTSVDNVGMQRSAVRAGAREVERYEHVLPNGVTVDAIRYTWDPPVAGPG